MMPIETIRTATIDATRDAVWAALADFGDIARWGNGIDHSTMLTPPRPDDPGPRVGDRRRVQVGRAALVETVTEIEQGRLLAYSIDGLPPVVPPTTNTWRLDDAADGTNITLTTRIDDPPRRPLRLVLRLVAIRLGRASDRLLRGLADHLASAPTKGTHR
jgi:uncharacterized protein YndB with AHSA1/START domain